MTRDVCTRRKQWNLKEFKDTDIRSIRENEVNDDCYVNGDGVRRNER